MHCSTAPSRTQVLSSASTYSRTSLSSTSTLASKRCCSPKRILRAWTGGVCVLECLIGKQRKPILFKVTEPSSIPFTELLPCAKRAAYPDPPPVIPLPDTGVAQVTTSPGRGLLVAVSWRTKTEMTEFRTWVSSGPKYFQVLGLSPSLLQNPML